MLLNCRRICYRLLIWQCVSGVSSIVEYLNCLRALDAAYMARQPRVLLWDGAGLCSDKKQVVVNSILARSRSLQADSDLRGAVTCSLSPREAELATERHGIAMLIRLRVVKASCRCVQIFHCGGTGGAVMFRCRGNSRWIRWDACQDHHQLIEVWPGS